MATNRAGFAAKDRISHTVYGLGTISQVSEHYTIIAFDGNGTKKFVTSMVELERSDEPAPVRVRAVRKSKKVAG